MLFGRFGLKRIRDKRPSPVDALIDLKPDSLESSALQIVLREFYEDAYGLHDFDSPSSSPLALVAAHPKEDTFSGSRFRQLLWRYRKHEIGEKFHLSLTEFLELPREIVEELFEISTQESAKGTTDAARELAVLEREAGRHKP